MNFQPWLEYIVMAALSFFGAYLAVRVELARINEKMKAQDARLDDHAERIKRLEGEYFRAD